jgi:hypothetical protein
MLLLLVLLNLLHEPELLETLYVTQQLHREAANLTLFWHSIPHAAAAGAA